MKTTFSISAQALPLCLALLLAACGNSDNSSAVLGGGSGADSPQFSNAGALSSPAGNAQASTRASIDGLAGAVLPNGRLLTPAGTQVSVQYPKPHALCLSPDGTTVITVNLMGVNAQGLFPYGITKITGLASAAPTAAVSPVDATYNGCAFSKDSSRYYVAGGDNGNVWIGDTASGQWIGSINLSGVGRSLPKPLSPTDPSLIVRSVKAAFPGKMRLSPDGRWLYVVDQGAFKLHVIDTSKLVTGQPGAPISEPDNFAAVVNSVDTGWYPYAVNLSPDGRQLFVANIGVFRYSHLAPSTITGVKGDDYPLCYPAAGYPEEMQEPRTITVKPVDSRNLPASLREANAIRCGYVTREKTITVPAVGDPNADESSSLYVYELGDPANPVLQHKLKSGALIGEFEDGLTTYGASHPNSIVHTGRSILVANGNHDTISVFHPRNFTETARIALSPFTGGDQSRKGVLPTAMVLSPDGNTLYVSEAGLNAVAVIALDADGGLDGRSQVLGHIPVGWWPSDLALSADGKTLYVSNAKGMGAGASSAAAGYQLAANGPKNMTTGTVSIVTVPDAATLAADTLRVMKNNGLVASASNASTGTGASPIPSVFGVASGQIKHVILINKENATYDLLLGHITRTRSGQAVEGLPANSVTQSVVPNHTELALQFAFSDNFYLEPVSSSDGHRWMAGLYATEYEENHWPTAYGQKRADSGDNADLIKNFPGRVGFSGANESAEPIDYNKHGGIFHHLVRNNRSVMNFGNGTEFAIVDEGSSELAPTGISEHVNIPMEKDRRDHSDHLYAGFNTHIPDSPLPNDPTRYNRYSRFKQVFESQLAVNGECRLAAYTTLYFPNDHGGGAADVESNNPWSFQRFIQDNDAALGMSIDLISHSPCWKDTAIFVVEDDTQNGVDHVSGYRSIAMVLSPWAKRQYVSHVHTSLPGVFKTIYLILGVPPLNAFDALSTDFRDLFAATPDYTPYIYQPVSYLSAPGVAGVTALAVTTPQGVAAAKSWAQLTRGVHFNSADADEINLQPAIIRQLGLPNANNRSLDEEQPELYLLTGLKQFDANLARLIAPRDE